MGKGTTFLNESSPRETARQLEGEIVRLREELGGLVGELDRRRHELLDVKLQLRRHPLAASLVALPLVAAAGGLVALGIRHHRRGWGVLSQARWPREALEQMMDRSERKARQPSLAGRIATGLLAAAAAKLVQQGLGRGLRAALACKSNGREPGAARSAPGGDR